MAAPVELAELTLESFLPLVAQQFRLHAGDAELNALLVEARAVGQSLPDRRQAFSLIFTGPASPVLPQSIYRVEHASLGELDVFLVPVGLRDSRVEYQAVFN